MDLSYSGPFSERNLVTAGDQGWYLDSCRKHLPVIWVCTRSFIHTNYGTKSYCISCETDKRREAWKQALRVGGTGPFSYSRRVPSAGRPLIIQVMNAAGLP